MSWGGSSSPVFSSPSACRRDLRQAQLRVNSRDIAVRRDARFLPSQKSSAAPRAVGCRSDHFAFSAIVSMSRRENARLLQQVTIESERSPPFPGFVGYFRQFAAATGCRFIACKRFHIYSACLLRVLVDSSVPFPNSSLLASPFVCASIPGFRSVFLIPLWRSFSEFCSLLIHAACQTGTIF